MYQMYYQMGINFKVMSGKFYMTAVTEALLSGTGIRCALFSLTDVDQHVKARMGEAGSFFLSS